MRQPILEICQRLNGYSSDPECFEIVRVIKLENGNFEIEVREVNKNEEAK